jgi:hypothetical protein
MFRLLGVDEEILIELEENITTVGFSSSGYYFWKDGTRRTGEPQTSSGNSGMNAPMNIIMLREQIPFEIDWSNPPFAIMVQGDDILIITLPSIVQYIQPDVSIEIAASMGFLVKFYDITTEMAKLDYCSRYFWPTDSHPLGYVLGPKIGKVLNKIGYSRTATKCPYARNRGIALSLYKDVQHVPFLREWVRTLIQLTEGVEAEKLPYSHSIHSREPSQPNDNTYEFLYDLYGLTESDIYEWTVQLSKVQSLPWHIEVDWVEHVLSVDYA